MSFLPGMSGAICGGFTRGFPRVENQATTVGNSLTTSHSTDLPSGIVAGEILMIVIAAGSAATASGWSALISNDITVLWKVATGSEGATVTVTTSGSTVYAAVAYRISNGQSVEAGSASGTSTNPDPPSLSPTWGAAKTLWFAAAESIPTSPGGTNQISAFPSGYTNTQNIIGSDGTFSQRLGTCENQIEAATENPGTFTLNSSRPWMAVTIAVRPQ